MVSHASQLIFIYIGRKSTNLNTGILMQNTRYKSFPPANHWPVKTEAATDPLLANAVNGVLL